ncbi:hypothetical protein JCM30566_02610 [Marinitoga arctica]
MKKQRMIYLISIFLTFIPFNLDSGIVLLLMGVLFSFLYIRIRKFGMPYYIAFLALFGIFMFTFFLLNAVESRNLYYSLNIIAITVLSYYLPEQPKDVIKFTFLFLIFIIMLRNLINPVFPLIALMISLFELLKEQKNKKIVILIYSVFIIFSIWNFNTYYNPFKNIKFSPDTQLLKEKQIENSKVNKVLEGEKYKTKKTVVEKKKNEFLGEINVEEKTMIKTNNRIVDLIIIINILIGGIIAIITAYITWKYLTKNERKKVIVSIIIFFSILVLMGTGIVYMKRGRPPMVDKAINSINPSDQLSNYNAMTSEQKMNIFREIVSSPRTAFVKLYEEIKWFYLGISILFGILITFIIVKFMKTQEKEKEFIDNFSVDKYEEEEIPNLIDVGYKYIRKQFFNTFSHLTPYELLYRIKYPEEFELLTNLFVLKEYGEKNYDYTHEEIKRIIIKSIDYFKDKNNIN